MGRKIVVTIICITLLAIITMINITYTYLNNLTERKVNELYKGDLTTIIYENGSQAPDKSNYLVPIGSTTSKYLQVKNISNIREIDSYVRVMLVPVFRMETGTLAGNMSLNPINNSIFIIAPNGSTSILNLIPNWSNYWIYSNGYYYYKKILHPNELTSALLQNITVADNTLWNSFQVEVLVDSIQAESKAASSIWGPGIAGQLEQP